MVHPDTTVIDGTWTVVVVIWVVFAFRTKRTIERRWRNPAPIIVIALAVIVVSRTGSGGGGWHRHLWIADSSLSVVSTALVVLGAAFAVWARLTIGTNWSGNVTLKENHELVVRGPYRMVRHPIYTGLIAMGIGTALIYAEAVGFVAVGAGIVVFGLRIPQEEKLMTETFPDQYPEYRRRVKAVIPYVL
jgi:protein-S-isoprenylcysteine O-methyltransferase Ste14